jgi:tetratricopeptide (TPR) repeat protein
MTALESAPRHPEICKLVAALDSAFAERTEAALGLLVESLPITHFGLLGGQLLYRTGDRVGAEAAVHRQVQLEPYAPLAALTWLGFAELCDSAAERLPSLDRALGISPRSTPARWARFEARLATSDVNGAVSDAEHLEAASRGSRERHEVLRRAAERVRDSGFLQPAGRLFERALRYLPREGRAELGLAECLIATGKHERALPLLTRATEDDDEATRNRACLVLAQLLAEAYRDPSQAVAWAQRVTALSPRDAIEARSLEATWRAQLGDLKGAALAYGRLHDLVGVSRDFDAMAAAYHLLEGARFALEGGDDLHAAHRLAALALRLCPKDPRVQGRYRAIAGLLGQRREDAAEVADPSEK